MVRLLLLILTIYVCFTQYLMYGYGKMNTKLQRTNNTLLTACSQSKLDTVEFSQYK